jgi:hypothetical protein
LHTEFPLLPVWQLAGLLLHKAKIQVAPHLVDLPLALAPVVA